MLYFVCALYCEAAPLIKALGMKKNNSYTRFQLFESDEARLILSGTGNIQSAVAASCLFSIYPPQPEDTAVNFGICGIQSKTVCSNIYLCSQIIDTVTQNTYYPDMIWKHPFQENTIYTVPSVIQNAGSKSFIKSGQLFDMEASGFYQACQHFFSCHQIFVLKVPSDNGSSFLKPDLLTHLLTEKVPSILSWLFSFHNIFSEKAAHSMEERTQITYICEKLYLSETMKHRFFQLLHFYQLEHTDILLLLESILAEIEPIKTKREGKQYFEKLTARLIY